MNPRQLHARQTLANLVCDRRAMMRTMGGGVLAAALAELNSSDASEVASSSAPHQDTLPRRPYHRPRAKAMIHLFMNGGPSQMDLFDPKPELQRRHGEDYFESIAGEVEFPDAAGALMRSPFKFAQHGQSGMYVSELMPHLAKQVDDITLIRSMHTSNLTHEPAIYKMQSGSEFIGRFRGEGDGGNGFFIQLTADIDQDVAIPDDAGSETSTMTLLHWVRPRNIM